MALIKCKECGHDVSDKASKCPNCGCPIESVGAAQEEVMDEEPKKKKGWVWILVVALLCLIGGGGYYAYAKLLNCGNSKGSAIVELTPEFVSAIQKYEKLGSFSEGMAAVMRDGKWGYINTKGEEVIPCQFPNPDDYYTASSFYEGMALIKKDGKWGFINNKGEEVIPVSIEAEAVGRFSGGLAFVYKDNENFSVIDKEGKKVFGGKCDFSWYLGPEVTSEFLPVFYQGNICIPLEPDKFAVYDKQGNKTKEIDTETADKLNKQDDMKPYTIFSKDKGDNEEHQYNTVGLKDANGTELIPAIYDGIENVGVGERIDASNGVVLVVLDEIGEGVSEGYGGRFYSPDTKRYYGYADLQGNDTFTQEVKDRCRKSREKAMQELDEKRKEEEKEYDEYDVQSESVSSFDDTASEDYEVRKWLKGQWVRAEIDPTMVEIIYNVYTFYPDGFNFSYGSEHTYRQSRDRFPYTVNGDVICVDGNPMLRIDRERNVLVDCKKPEETYEKR